MKKGGLYLCILVVLLSSVYGLKVFPTQTDLGSSFYEDQSFVLTVVNDGPRVEDIVMQTELESLYLDKYVVVEPKEFRLEQAEKKNILLHTTFPKNLSPEQHWYKIRPLSQYTTGEVSTFTFKIDGVQKHDLQLLDVDLNENSIPLVADFTFANKGNVIARVQPKVKISGPQGIIEEKSYEARYMVMPFSTEKLSVFIDTISLESGNYTFEFSAAYSGRQTNLLQESISLSVEERKQKKSSTWWWYLLLVPIAALVYRYRKYLSTDTYKQMGRVSNIETRVKNVEQEIDSIATAANNLTDRIEHGRQDR
ncbi:hypothetical protein H6504_02610 [Candidatus Woesearchaeota archaeon]|nr:hypothetical protein [Candidatus Woesearchaeota archaeon]